MEREYDVLCGGVSVGRVRVTRQGLYNHFSCRCRPPRDEVCRLFVRCGNREEKLGVPVPGDGGFFLETSIPVKRLGEGEPEFRLVPKSEGERPMKLVPIYPEEPFAYIARLKDAYLAEQGGHPAAAFSEEAALDAFREK